MHGVGMKETPGIAAIFQKDEEGNYTKDALLYQDILKYSIVIKDENSDNNSFRDRQLTRWLIGYNQDFVNYYKGSDSHIKMNNRIENRLPRIKAKINDLVHLCLIKISGTTKASKVDTDIYIYKHTEFGQLLAWVIASINSEKQADANNEVFNLLDSVFFKIKDDSPSATIFYSHFFRKCRDRGLFDKLVQHIWYIAHMNLGIKNMQDLFQRVVDLGFEDENMRRNFFNLWRETLEKLGSNQKALVLYQMKLDAERRFQNKKEYLTSEYEEMRFLYRDDYSRIAVEGSCEKCNLQQGSIMLDFLDYREALAHGAPTDSIKTQCPSCSTKDSLVIANFNF
jgi:hypothetical protein